MSQGLKRGEAAIQEKMMKNGPGEQPVISRTIKTHIKHLSSHARVAAELANPGLASEATQDNPHQQPLRVLLHSQSTDGCQKNTSHWPASTKFFVAGSLALSSFGVAAPMVQVACIT